MNEKIRTWVFLRPNLPHIMGMRFAALTPAQDRSLHELRQGRAIRLELGRARALRCDPIDTSATIKLRDGGYLLVSGARAEALGYDHAPLVLPIDPSAGDDQLTFLVTSKTHVDLEPLQTPAFAANLVDFAKQGRMIPAFYISEMSQGDEEDLLSLDVNDLELEMEAPPLRRVSTVPLPLHVGDAHIETRALLFEGGALREEALALQIGDMSSEPPLVRLHSACLTGDVFGSLRCDCGPQLNTALQTMADVGAGCLLYMPQEGRDTGLSNKLRAYALQDAGLDTIDADGTLGFESDERDFAFAAALLKHQGLERIRLMTNNPAKVSSLSAAGIEVVERVPLAIPAHTHNAAYLKTKAERAGHKL